MAKHTPINQIRQENCIREVSLTVVIKRKYSRTEQRWFDNTLPICELYIFNQHTGSCFENGFPIQQRKSIRDNVER